MDRDPDDHDLDAADEALAEALVRDLGDDDRLTRDDLAERTGVPVAVLEAIEREGLLRGRPGDGAAYTSGDVDAVTAGLALLEAGVPLSELLALGRRLDDALGEVADHAVDVFLRFVRDQVHADADTAGEASERLVGAFREMLPATTRLVGHHFRQLLLQRARGRLEERMSGDAPR